MYLLIPAAGLLALVFAGIKASLVKSKDPGNETMRTIAGHIQEGAMAFLGREYKVLAIFVAIVAVLLAVSNRSLATSSWLIGVSFVVGASASALARSAS